MNKRILVVLGGFRIGGVETYIVRLVRKLAEKGHDVEIMVLSNKADSGLMAEVSRFSKLTVIERFPYLSASSWLNGQIPVSFDVREFDIVHAVDMLSLWFLYVNKNHIKFRFLSIGIYHSAELEWWRDKSAYFRDAHLALYNDNAKATLFPSESVVNVAKRYCALDDSDIKVLPLGIDLARYSTCSGSSSSNRIVSVGRLVDFKTYNRLVISVLPELRKFREFNYHIYGSGPELAGLKSLAAERGVLDCVHFEGEVSYSDLPTVLNNCFCFVGSGTTIIEASASGIPSIVGIESMNEAVTSGLFCNVQGYSYNEAHATDVRIGYLELFNKLISLSDEDYLCLSMAHRKKAAEFDLDVTSDLFVELSREQPNFDSRYSVIGSVVSFVYSVLKFGPGALKRRFAQF